MRAGIMASDTHGKMSPGAQSDAHVMQFKCRVIMNGKMQTTIGRQHGSELSEPLDRELKAVARRSPVTITVLVLEEKVCSCHLRKA
jgi:hypothetical protein